MMLLLFFDISTGLRFSKISVGRPKCGSFPSIPVAVLGFVTGKHRLTLPSAPNSSSFFYPVFHCSLYNPGGVRWEYCGYKGLNAITQNNKTANSANFCNLVSYACICRTSST